MWPEKALGSSLALLPGLLWTAGLGRLRLRRRGGARGVRPLRQENAAGYGESTVLFLPKKGNGWGEFIEGIFAGGGKGEERTCLTQFPTFFLFPSLFHSPFCAVSDLIGAKIFLSSLLLFLLPFPSFHDSFIRRLQRGKGKRENEKKNWKSKIELLPYFKK